MSSVYVTSRMTTVATDAAYASRLLSLPPEILRMTFGMLEIKADQLSCLPLCKYMLPHARWALHEVLSLESPTQVQAFAASICASPYLGDATRELTINAYCDASRSDDDAAITECQIAEDWAPWSDLSAAIQQAFAHIKPHTLCLMTGCPFITHALLTSVDTKRLVKLFMSTSAAKLKHTKHVAPLFTRFVNAIGPQLICLAISYDQYTTETLTIQPHERALAPLDRLQIFSVMACELMLGCTIVAPLLTRLQVFAGEIDAAAHLRNQAWNGQDMLRALPQSIIDIYVDTVSLRPSAAELTFCEMLCEGLEDRELFPRLQFICFGESATVMSDLPIKARLTRICKIRKITIIE